MKKPIVHMIACMSLDGYIARSGEAPNQEKYGGWTSAEDKQQFWEEVRKADFVMAGRNTLNEMPRLHKPVILLTRKANVPLTSRVAEDVGWELDPYVSTVRSYLDKLDGKRILLCGGATSFDFMLRWNFVDIMTLVIEPVFLKTGIRITVSPPFKGGQEENKFVLLGSKVLNPRGTMRMDLRRVTQWTQ